MTIKWVDDLGTGVCGSRRYLSNASKILAVLACALLFCVFAARSQQNTADILGTVTDTSGAIIPGASVTLTNTGTNISQTAQTNQATTRSAWFRWAITRLRCWPLVSKLTWPPT